MLPSEDPQRPYNGNILYNRYTLKLGQNENNPELQMKLLNGIRTN